jgi:hypothetical protein
VSSTSTVIKAKFDLDDATLENYERQAEQRGIELDALFQERLTATVAQTSIKPIYIDDTTRQRLEQILGRNLYRAADLVAAVEKLSLLKLENAKVHFEPELLERLRSRHFSDLPFDAWLARQVHEWAEQFVGLR